MFGKIVVEAAGGANVPASLPNTGGGASAPLLPLLLGALLLLIGALLRGLRRRPLS
jgi:hypothetical protein